jgi:2-amino-4-hydroxy-6-hydroxymethyldihydropteridine diphosphokinase
MSQTIAYIGLGSNLGDRKRFIEKAVRLLGDTPNITVTGVSAIVETKPLGDANQPSYLNCVAEVQTTLTSGKLHQQLHSIEKTLGRERKEKWGPRTIDLDLLLFGEKVINTKTLSVPHPMMHLRSFVLNGLFQLNSSLRHPILNEPVKTLAERLNGENFVSTQDVPQLICLAGNIGAGKTTLARKLALIFSCRVILEAYDTNPYLAKVYAGNRDLALDSQLYFLTSRLEQLGPGALEKGRPVVADYIFQKEQIYAKLLLNAEQLALYQKVYALVSPAVAGAVLVIYLLNSPQQCLERIHRRNRPYEQGIENGFLETINAGYEQLLSDWKLCPVIRLTNFDCLDENSVDSLGRQVKYYISAK